MEVQQERNDRTAEMNDESESLLSRTRKIALVLVVKYEYYCMQLPAKQIITADV